jgi:hypothetical protein
MPQSNFQKVFPMDFLPLHVVNKSMEETRATAVRCDVEHKVHYIDGKRFEKNRHILFGLWKRDEKKYRSAQLARHNGGWWLMYEGKLSTGGFKNKHEAIGWFERNGR